MLTALFAGLGWLLNGFRTASLFAFCALLGLATVYWYGDRVLFGSVGARPYALAEDPLLRSTVDRIAAVAGVGRAKLYVIDDPFPRVFVAGRGPRSYGLAVSLGLLGSSSPAELEGLLAHELGHVRSRDVLTQTLGVVLALTLVELSRIGGWFARALLFVFGPIASAFTHLLISQRRELLADRFAVQITGSAAGLTAALVRLNAAAELVDFRGSPATEPLYAVDLFADDRLASLFKTHPRLDDRLARLRALD